MRRDKIVTSAYRSRLALGLVAAALSLGVAGCGEEGTAETAPEEATLVLGAGDVHAAELSRIAGGVVVTGSLQPYRVVDVKAQVAGTIGDLRADRGDPVRQGQLLANIEAAGIRGQAAGARAGVAAAQANLALAEQRLESARTLFEAGAMSQLDFRASQAAYESARAQLAAAQAQSAGAGEAASRASVVAPITGEISRREVSGGEAVSPGQSLFTVVNTDFLELAGQVPVNQAAGVRVGQAVEFTMSGYPGRVFRGEVARVEPTADQNTRQLGVYVRLANPNRALVGGLFATGRILSGEQAEAVVVPVAALREEGGQTFVWVIENGVIARRVVAVGSRDEAAGVVAIASGLQAGEQVVVAPGAIQEGTRVQVGAAAPAVADKEG